MLSKENFAPAKTLWGFALYFIKRHWLSLLFTQFLWFAWCIDQTIFPLLFGKIVDGFSTYIGDRQDSWSVLKGPILSAIALWISVEVAFRCAGLLMSSTFPSLDKEIRMYIFSHMLNQSQSYFSTHFAGEISTKISDMVDNLNHILQLLITLFIPSFVAVVIASYIFYQLSPFFASLLIGWALIHIGVGIVYSFRCTYYSHLHSETRSRLNGRIVDSLTNYFAVKIFANKLFELKYVGASQTQELHENRRQMIYIEKVRLILGALTFFGPGMALNGYAYYSWVHNSITVGDIVLVFNTSWNIIMILWWTSLELPNFFKEIGICKQALSLLKAPVKVVDAPAAKDILVKKGKIQFQKVHFQYRDETPFFTEKSVLIQPGQKIGLVGYSGSGKSTFVNLILRLFDIQSGQILVDGQDIAKVTQESLRKAIALIPQESTLFHRTIIDNIRYGRPDASDDDVIVAAQKAHAHEFILGLSGGYKALVGERGAKLSGGQRQSITIARAILKDAPILILDEATSALDSVTENLIQESLSLLMEGRTALVVAHRLSTLLNMDRLLVFDQGKIVEDGTHKSLIKKGGLYKTLWSAQVGGFLPDGGAE